MLHGFGRRWQTAKRALRNFPAASLTLAIVAIVFYLEEGRVHYYQYSFGPAPAVNFLLSPFIHGSVDHLVGNVFGILLVGPVVEVWMTRLSRISRYVMMSFGYPLGLGIGAATVHFYGWHFVPIGASGLIASWLGFCTAYYASFYRDLSPVDNLWDAFPPVAMGISFLCFIFQPPFGTSIEDTLRYNMLQFVMQLVHFYFFLPSLAIGLLLFRKFRVGTSRPQVTEKARLDPVSSGLLVPVRLICQEETR